jgi:hypothetical protein
VAVIGFEITLYTTGKCALLMDRVRWRAFAAACCGRRGGRAAKQGADDGGGERSPVPALAAVEEESGQPQPQLELEDEVEVEEGTMGVVTRVASASAASVTSFLSTDGEEGEGRQRQSPAAPPRLRSCVSLEDSMQPPPPPFSPQLHLTLGLVALAAGLTSLLLFRLHPNTNTTTSPGLLPHTLFTFALNLFCYVTGARAPPRFRRVINPIISGSLLALLLLYLHGLASGLPFQGELALYLTGRSPLGFLDAGKSYRWVGGGGDILYYCLEPSVLALGICELYGREGGGVCVCVCVCPCGWPWCV